MKGLILMLIFFSQLLFSQNNIAIFHSNKSTVSASATVGKVVSIAPFELVNGMAIVKASIDGVVGNFILDTGSPGLVINSPEPVKKSVNVGASVGGTVEVGEAFIENFKWGIIEKEALTGFTIDISHLERATGRKLAGLIGYEILHQYEVFFDYPNEVVKMYDAANAVEFRKVNPSIVVSFEMIEHLPTIEVQVGSKKAMLGLDSGAEVNLLDRSFFRQLDKSLLGNKNKEKVVGLDRMEHDVISALLDSSKINDHELSAMKFLFMELDGLKGLFGSRFDGLLGFPFFQQHAVSINYLEKKIYIWS